MAGTDPRKTRDFGPTSEAQDYDADEDPLVELARIVSEDGGFSSRMAQRAPRAQPAAPAAETSANSSDLEAELLEELETSFPSRVAPAAISEPPTAHPEPIAPIEPAPAPPRAADRQEPAPAQSDDPDDLLRSIEEQLSQFEQRVRADSFGPRFDVADEDDDVDWSGRNGHIGRTPADPAEDVQEPWPPSAASPEYRFRGPAADRAGPSSQRAYASLPDEEPEAPITVAGAGAAAGAFGHPASATRRPPADYADAPEEEAPSGGNEETQADELYAARDRAASREPEAGEPEFSGFEAELTRELGSTYQGYDAGTEQDDDMSRRADMDDEARGEDDSGVVAAAVIAPGHGMRPPPRPRAAAAASRGRSRKGLVTAAAIVLVVVIGGAAAMYLRSLEQGPSGPPPVIAAPEGPVKIAPAGDEQASAEETVGQSVYDQVAGRASEAEENVVEGAEEPREIERIVLPQSGGDNDNVLMRPVGGDEAGAEAGRQAGTGSQSDVPAGAEAQDDGEEFGPRRVATYVVRPDGTIVTTSEAGAGGGDAADAGLSGQQMAAAQTESMDPKPVQTVTIDEPRTAGTAATRNNAGGGPSTAANPPSVSTTVEEAAAPPAAQSEPAAEATDAPMQLTEIEPAPAEEPQQQVAAAPVPPPAPAAGSGFVVQLAAQTSEQAAQATFAALQQRYGPILGGLDANIQRADLGERGIYYRVRVGPWAERAEAVQVCEALQAAGGDCYVTQ